MYKIIIFKYQSKGDIFKHLKKNCGNPDRIKNIVRSKLWLTAVCIDNNDNIKKFNLSHCLSDISILNIRYKKIHAPSTFETVVLYLFIVNIHMIIPDD